MRVVLIFEFDRNGNEAPVTNASFGNNMPCEVLDIAHRAPQHRDLHATVVVKVDVHRRDRQMMVGVKGAG